MFTCTSLRGIAILPIFVLNACGPHTEDGPEAFNPPLTAEHGHIQNEFEFITFGPSVSGLVAKVKQERLTVCLQGAYGNNFEKWSDWISSSVLKWVEPMRALTSDALASVVDVTTGGECDANVNVVSGAWGYASIGRTPKITVGPTIPYGVLFHEFGHGFALGDTYTGGRSGACKSGQPQSVMCNISFSELQPDDIAGVSTVFKRTFPNDKPGETPPEPKEPNDPSVPNDPSDPNPFQIRVAWPKQSNGQDSVHLYFSSVGGNVGKMSYCLSADDHSVANGECTSGWTYAVKIDDLKKTTSALTKVGIYKTEFPVHLQDGTNLKIRYEELQQTTIRHLVLNRLTMAMGRGDL